MILQLLFGLPLLCVVGSKMVTEFKYTQWGYKGKHRIRRNEFPWRNVTHDSQSA